MLVQAVEGVHLTLEASLLPARVRAGGGRSSVNPVRCLYRLIPETFELTGKLF